jgi:WXG100 family type VII secretion target
VDPQELAHAAGRLRGDADRLLARHGSSLATADGARPGLVGQSARSIDSTARRWRTTTTELHQVLTSQADALASVAAAYAQTEDDNRDMMTSLDPTSL